jgi:PAS domain-containing protein
LNRETSGPLDTGEPSNGNRRAGNGSEPIALPQQPFSPSQPDNSAPDLIGAEATLNMLAALFAQESTPSPRFFSRSEGSYSFSEEVRYRSLVDQLPAVVFMASLDKGVGDAYVSPQIEAALGFSQNEWLQDPIRWYQRIHPDDKARWSTEAAEMFISGTTLKSACRVMSRDGRVV